MFTFMFTPVMLDVFDNVIGAISNITASLQRIILPGGGLMILICAIASMFVDEQEHAQWKRRLKQVIKGAAIAMLSTVMINYVAGILQFNG